MIAVLGAGPHGRQIAAILRDEGRGPVLYDDDQGQHPHLLDCVEGAKTHPWIAGQAWPEQRRALVQRLYDRRIVGPRGGGVMLWPGAHLGDEVTIGHHTHIQYNAVIAHGSSVGEFTLICAGAVLGGDTTVGPDVVIGSNATVSHGGITIGAGAFVGAGAVIIDDVPPGAVVAGNPGKVLAYDWSYRDMAQGRRGRAGVAPPL